MTRRVAPVDVGVTGKRNLKVRFHGREYWWLDDGAGEGPLAPLFHCDENGDVLDGSAYSDSYAHVYDGGVVMRFGKSIGTVDDFEVVEVRLAR